MRDSGFSGISAKELPAVYGPILELEQHLAYRLISIFTSDPIQQILWFKIFPGLSDLGTIVALLASLRSLGLPLERVLIYAWSPVPIFEFWATGHNDAFIVLFLLLALIAVRGTRMNTGYTFLSIAALAKFWPAILFPAFTGWKWRQILRAGAILGAVTLASTWPYWANWTVNAQVTSGFLGGWRNNDSLHGIVAWLAGNPYRAKYITTALIVGLSLAVAALPWKLEAKVLTTIVGMLAFSANVHPWYLSWVVPLLAIYPIPALLLWAALVPLTYAVLIDQFLLGQWNGITGWRWMVYVPVAAMAVLSWVLNRSKKQKQKGRPARSADLPAAHISTTSPRRSGK